MQQPAAAPEAARRSAARTCTARARLMRKSPTACCTPSSCSPPRDLKSARRSMKACRSAAPCTTCRAPLRVVGKGGRDAREWGWRAVNAGMMLPGGARMPANFCAAQRSLQLPTRTAAPTWRAGRLGLAHRPATPGAATPRCLRRGPTAGHPHPAPAAQHSKPVCPHTWKHERCRASCLLHCTAPPCRQPHLHPAQGRCLRRPAR